MDKVKKNVAYNMAYQILIYIIPLITAPYLSRTLGAEGLGIFSYSYSVVYYFSLVTILGLNSYGSKNIAQCGDDMEKRSKLFWNLYAMEVIIGLLMITVYLGYVLLGDVEYPNIAFIQTLLIVSSILDINWFFFGLEEFKITVTRNAIVKFTSLVFIFLLVKSESDLAVYTFIMCATPVVSQLIMWAFARKRMVFVKPEWSEMKKHFLPNLILFVPAIAGTMFKMMDKIMLGALSTFSEVGYYENAEKIISVPIIIITALGTVMLPRMSSMAVSGEADESEKYISASMDFAMFMASAMCFGLMAVSNNFAVVYYGAGFEKSGTFMMLLAVTIPLFSIANVIRSQYLIPNGLDKVYIISQAVGTVVNLVANLILIPKYAGVGACIGTILAELTVTLIHIYSVRDSLHVQDYLKNSVWFIVSGIIMFAIVYSMNGLALARPVKLILQILVGVIVYLGLNIRYINSNLDLKRIIKKSQV